MTPARVLPDHVAEAGIEALRTGWLTMGPRTQQLESALGDRFGFKHAIATSSGTAGLHLTLLAAGVGREDAVLVPELAPPSCAGAVEAVGARVETYALEGFHPDAAALGEAGAEGAAAAIARHHLGYPAELGALAERCSESGAVLIEDCRDALGALAPDGPVGTRGAASILSFSSRRVISCGEGGAVLTDDEALAAEVRSLRSHAMTSGSWDRHRGHAETYDVVGIGFNYRIDEVRAAMCEAALADLGERVATRRARALEIAAAGRALGASVPGAELIGRSSPEAVPMLAAATSAGDGGRDELVAGLDGHGVSASPVGASRLVVADLGE